MGTCDVFLLLCLGLYFAVIVLSVRRAATTPRNAGSNDIGKVLYVTSPIMKQAVKAINTAIGRWIKNFIMFFYLSINSTNHSSLTR
jgi:hypothetical protein